MNRLCPKKITCEPPTFPGIVLPDQFFGGLLDADSPIVNTSSEAPDPVIFPEIIWPPYEPDGGIPPDDGNPVVYESVGCHNVVYTAQSQEEADLLAAASFFNQDCIPKTGPEAGPDTQFYYNDAQTAAGNCNPLTFYYFTVPAGTYKSPIPLGPIAGAAFVLAANAVALAYAQAQVSSILQRVCISSPTIQGFVSRVCLESPLIPEQSKYIITGNNSATDFTFAIVSGALPPGVSLIKTAQNICELTGIPTSPGDYTFTIRATRTNFSVIVCEVTDTLHVFGITNPTLPDATVGTAYDEQLLTAGGTAPVSFTLIGTLPPGLGMDSTGHITGTPT